MDFNSVCPTENGNLGFTHLTQLKLVEKLDHYSHLQKLSQFDLGPLINFCTWLGFFSMMVVGLIEHPVVV